MNEKLTPVGSINNKKTKIQRRYKHIPVPWADFARSSGLHEKLDSAISLNVKEGQINRLIKNEEYIK